MKYESISSEAFSATPGLEDWRCLLDKAWAGFRAGSFQQATAFAGPIAQVSDELDHHPDIAIRYPDRVIVTLGTHRTGSLTTLDVALAQRISELAAEVGARSESLDLQQTEIALDTMDAEAIRPFWAAALAYNDKGNGDLVDPLGLGPALWFQQMDEPRTERNRFHLDVTVAHDIAEDRVAAVIAAGGRPVSDARARAFWVFADAEGNEVCICTWQDRPGPASS